MEVQIPVPKEKIAEFCKARGIKRLAIFGSALRSDFRPDSDVDVLIEFNTGRVPGLFGIARMEIELSGILGDRKVDLRTPGDLSRYFRDDVVKEAQVQYEQK
ncbi:MAG: nucleotidyltransferase family protein [Candidatus Dadabacteria bacterium]|nr:nucleotidyltransferase family protein [Candidatus Dadabacteria bacterium]